MKKIKMENALKKGGTYLGAVEKSDAQKPDRDP